MKFAKATMLAKLFSNIFFTLYSLTLKLFLKLAHILNSHVNYIILILLSLSLLCCRSKKECLRNMIKVMAKASYLMKDRVKVLNLLCNMA